MNQQEALDKVLRSFQQYYNINKENPEPPFAAEAEFSLHEEQYFLVKSARISEADSKEYVYFATVDQLDQKTLEELDKKAWELGLSKVRPHNEHRNTDVVLVVLADTITEEAKQQIPGMKHYKSYRWTLQGWSQYRLIALELSTGQAVANRQGRDLRKLVSNIF